MASPSVIDATSRQVKKVAKRWTPKKEFKPGGTPGKLHHRLGIPEGEKIPEKRLEQASHSKDPETKREAVRAKTMKRWRHPGRAALYPNTKA